MDTFVRMLEYVWGGAYTVGVNVRSYTDADNVGDLVDPKKQTKELNESLAFYAKQNIRYVAFTDVLKKIGFSKP